MTATPASTDIADQAMNILSRYPGPSDQAALDITTIGFAAFIANFGRGHLIRYLRAAADHFEQQEATESAAADRSARPALRLVTSTDAETCE